MLSSLYGWFERQVDPFPNDTPKAAPSTMMAYILHYAKPVWPVLALVGFTSALFSVLQIILFAFIGDAVDWLSSADPETFFSDQAGYLIAMSLLVLIGLPVLGFLHDAILFQAVHGNFPMRLRWLGHRQLLRQSMHFYQDEFAGRVATKLMQGALSTREVVVKALDVFAYVAVYFIGAVFLMASFDLLLMVPFILWLAGYVATMTYFLPKLRETSLRQADARSDMTGRVVDSYTNIPTVKLFAHSGREEAYAKGAMTGFIGTVYEQMRYVTGVSTCVNILCCLLFFSVGAIGLISWSNGAASIGAIAVGLALAMRMEGMSQWIMWETAALFENIGTTEDAMSMLSKKTTVVDRADAATLTAPDGAEVRFDDIRFNYGEEGPKGGRGSVIENLQLAIAPGEKIGLVGASGAGKSTLINLLLRFYDLQGGRITINGQNVAAVTQDSLRRHIAVVTQDTSLLHRSVAENIAYSRPDATMEEIVSAARRAKAHDFIEELTDPFGNRGYDAQVGERGVKLSGGQRQRIAIARVILKDAPILVLDEATSALDSEVELAIQESLYDLMEGKTVIAIAHRLSTIAQMDRLVVMERGRIVEEGTHERLVEAGGLYARLWSHQSGGFLLTAPDGEEEQANDDRHGNPVAAQ